MSDNPQLRAIHQLGHTYRALLSAFEATLGQSMPRWRILLRLYEHGTVSQKQLASDLRTDPAALTRQLKAIEQQGVILRLRDPADNRLSNVSLTSSGRELVEQTLPRRTEFLESVLSELSPDEMAALEKTLCRLEQRLRSQY